MPAIAFRARKKNLSTMVLLRVTMSLTVHIKIYFIYFMCKGVFLACKSIAYCVLGSLRGQKMIMYPLDSQTVGSHYCQCWESNMISGNEVCALNCRASSPIITLNF